MPLIKALVAAFGIGKLTRKKALRKNAKRWSGPWTLLVLLDIIRYLRRRKRKIVAKRIIKDGDVFVISSTVNRKKT